jgi:hypothetical protein
LIAVSKETTLVAELINDTSLYTFPDFEQCRRLNVEVCRVFMETDDIDWMEVEHWVRGVLPAEAS